MLKVGDDAEGLLEFYREDIASLEKIIISNPDLYQIRVFSAVDGIREMMPILYGAERMARMPWAREEPASGSWSFDFDDQLFSEYPVTRHIMSLLTDIADADGKVGELEVAVRMDKLMPELFSGDESRWAALLDADGRLVAGKAFMDAAAMREIPLSDEPEQLMAAGRHIVAVRTEIRELGCVYLQVTDISDIYASFFWQACVFFMVFIAAALLMTAAVSRIARHMLRGFYSAFDGIRAFAEGDMEASVKAAGEGEIADFAKEVDALLIQLRQSLKDNIEREAQIQRAEVRALQNQINTHFIYNVLEAIRMMAEIDEKYEIADAVTSLGKLLRYSMKLGGIVELEMELDYIKNYIDLMNLRFDHVITLVIDVPQELLSQQIPRISLQPVVENAVVHGAAALAADSAIRLRGEISSGRDRYTISITDEGAGMDADGLNRLRRQIAGEEPTRSGSSGNGIGLKNVHDRIRLSFGETYGLRVESQPGAGVTVMADLPYRGA